jgi:hypothetical protein
LRARTWNALLFGTTCLVHLRKVDRPRANRAFSENTIYKRNPRTREILPMALTKTAHEKKLGILGRTQRGRKMELCHVVDMNNHSHTVAVSNRCETLSKFFMELQKRTTDAGKALLGQCSLSLWEDCPTVAEVATLQDAIKRMVYIHSNPSSASLCSDVGPSLRPDPASTRMKGS